MLCKLAERYIKWPSTSEHLTLSKGFKFPFTIGAVDGSHIQIKAPLDKLDAYTNRKSYTSVVLQGICDSTMKFLDISVGWAGSMHDARIFRLSALGQKLDEEGLHPFHILGDSAYPLKSYLIVPFRDNGHLSANEKQFNLIHSASRCIVERAFALLKGKFRRLKYLDMDNMSLVSDVITAACVLHNFILMHDCGAQPQDTEGPASDVLDVDLDINLSPSDRRLELLQMIL